MIINWANPYSCMVDFLSWKSFSDQMVAISCPSIVELTMIMGCTACYHMSMISKTNNDVYHSRYNWITLTVAQKCIVMSTIRSWSAVLSAMMPIILNLLWSLCVLKNNIVIFIVYKSGFGVIIMCFHKSRATIIILCYHISMISGTSNASNIYDNIVFCSIKVYI